MFIPSILIPQVYYPYSEERNMTAEILRRIAEEGYYKAIEIDCHYEKEERKKIGTIIGENDWTVTQWLTSLIDKEQLDLSSLEDELRTKSVKAITSMLSNSKEMGVHNIAFISGPSPGDELRKSSLEAFYKSLVEICKQAETYGLNVLIEPLDYRAHKCKVLGTTDETIDLIKRVREESNNIFFAFDTAHAALNSENAMKAVVKALPWMEQIHFSNAILDTAHELYGDHHIAIGEPGFLSSEVMHKILKEIKDNKSDKTNIRVSIEARGSSNQKLHENELKTREVLANSLMSVREG